MIGWNRLLVLVAALAVLATGCVASKPAPVTAGGWQETPLPVSGARALAMAPIDGGLLVLGSVPEPKGRAPAAWTTTDGRNWHAVPLRPHSAYAPKSELVLVGVAGGQATVLGQAFGGAHGNPRLTVWSGGTAGLVEHEQPFEMFGGPHAIAVNGAAALPGTALLIGQWDGASGRYGAAVWTSPDGADWRREAEDPALASSPGEQTSALGAAAGPMGFLVAGDTLRGAGLTPLAWTSPDGRSWQRIEAPPLTTPHDGATADRAACDGMGCVLIGVDAGQSQHARCWPVRVGGTTITVGAGEYGPSSSTVQVSQALLHGGQVFAALRTDGNARLASVGRDCTGWRNIPLPVNSREACVGELAGGLVLATTDPTSSRLWLRAG